MKKKINQPTLVSLEKMVREGFASVNHQLIQLSGETTYTRNEVNSLRSELGSLHSEMNQKFVDVDKRFDKNDKYDEEILDAVRDFVGSNYDILNKRVAKLETNWYTKVTI